MLLIHTRRAAKGSADLDLPSGVELCRLRLGKWRIIYAVNEAEGWIWVLGIRQRPPYDYGDLPEVASRLGH